MKNDSCVSLQKILKNMNLLGLKTDFCCCLILCKIAQKSTQQKITPNHASQGLFLGYNIIY